MSEFVIPSSGELPPPPQPAHPPPGTPVALTPDDIPGHPMRAHDVPALLAKNIG